MMENYMGIRLIYSTDEIQPNIYNQITGNFKCRVEQNRVEKTNVCMDVHE